MVQFPGALSWLFEIIRDERFQPAIYSSRSKDPGGVEAMRAWLVKGFTELESDGTNEEQTVNAHLQAIDMVNQLEFPTQKPAAVMTIDDRAYRFEGRFPSLDWLDRFKPWNKREPEANDPEHPRGTERDLDLAEEALDCISDCMVRYEGKSPGYLYGGGNYYFEPSTRDYLAGMFAEARKKIKEG